MKKGVAYHQDASRAMRVVSVVVTPVLLLYTVLIVVGLVPSTHYSDGVLSLGIMLIWLLLSVYFYVTPTTSRRDATLRVILYHILALSTFVFTMGFAQPFVALFVLLFLACYIYFGVRGLLVSAGSLAIVATIDAAMRYSFDQEIIVDNGLTVFSVIFLGFCIIAIMNAQETRRQTLLHSQERERLQYDRVLTIMNNLTDAAFSTNEKGMILMYNAASLDLLDTNDSLRGRSIGELFHLTTAADNVEVDLFELLKDAKRATRRDDLNHTYSDGEAVRLEITFAPIRSSYSLSKKGEEQGGYILIMRDVTKQKSLEEERDEFISVVSHELRTPITIVEGTLSNLEVLTTRKEALNQKMLEKAMTTAHDQVLYLARMVNDLSTLSRAERGIADTPEVIDAAELLHAMHRQYEKEAATRKLHLNLDLGTKLGTVNASRLYLEELLQNFITNSIKYTNEGSVTIAAKRTKNVVHFAIKDTGIGISRSDQNKIFNKFYRSEDYRIRETNGTGLGLYVSAKLAHKLHTHIEVKSRLNHGSSFSFELPVE
ncbi:MAG TPA: ATP-binding protein [Dongiaceae bacterium]|nr:ATP-binding protein [Dongiaceae bacterium]